MPKLALYPSLITFLPFFLQAPVIMQSIVTSSFGRARPVHRGASLGLFTDKDSLEVDFELALRYFLSDTPRCFGEFEDWLV